MHKNGRLFGFGVSPSDDWRILSVVLLVLALVVSALGVYMFVQINQGQIFMVEEQQAGGDVSLLKNNLKSTVNYYTERQTNFLNIRNNKETLADPSGSSLSAPAPSTSSTTTPR